MFLQIPTRHSFAVHQHCMLCLSFPSTYQILQKHLFLHFSIFTIFRSLFSNSATFSLFFSFSISSTLASTGTAISITIPFCSFLSITINSVRPWLYQIVLLHSFVPQNFDLFIFYCSFQSMLIALFAMF